MKGSKYHKIVAAVLEVMEEALTTPQKDVNLQESGTPEEWKMMFLKSGTTLDEMNGIKKQLGPNFRVQIMPRDKATISVIVQAPSIDFLALIKEKPEITGFGPRPILGGGAPSPSGKPEEEIK